MYSITDFGTNRGRLLKNLTGGDLHEAAPNLITPIVGGYNDLFYKPSHGPIVQRQNIDVTRGCPFGLNEPFGAVIPK